ncbi:MAG: hypothetical protein ACTSYC_00280 [Promethearchaeota archaeon]
MLAYSFCKLLIAERLKLIVSIYGVISWINEIFLFIFFFTDLILIGKSTTRFNIEHEIYPFTFQIFSIATALIT